MSESQLFREHHSLAKSLLGRSEVADPVIAPLLVAQAQVHATLAVAAALVIDRG